MKLWWGKIPVCVCVCELAQIINTQELRFSKIMDHSVHETVTSSIFSDKIDSG